MYLLKKVSFKQKYIFKKLSESGNDAIFLFREDRHPWANIESSPLSLYISIYFTIFFKSYFFLKILFLEDISGQ